MTAIAQTAVSPLPTPQRVERTRFCSRCAVTADDPPEGQSLPYGFDRVCDRCGMGVMLSAPQKALPGPGAAFLVITRDGRISAVSEPAERLVGDEADLVGMSVTAAVVNADDDIELVRALARAAGGGREILQLRVTPGSAAHSRTGRMTARIASCGPPRAALLVLERAPV